jgi:hypothetical protein
MTESAVLEVLVVVFGCNFLKSQGHEANFFESEG